VEPIIRNITVIVKISSFISSRRSYCFRVGVIITHFLDIVISNIILPNYTVSAHEILKWECYKSLSSKNGWLISLASKSAFRTGIYLHSVRVLPNFAYSLPLVIALVLQLTGWPAPLIQACYLLFVVTCSLYLFFHAKLWHSSQRCGVALVRQRLLWTSILQAIISENHSTWFIV